MVLDLEIRGREILLSDRTIIIPVRLARGRNTEDRGHKESARALQLLRHGLERTEKKKSWHSSSFPSASHAWGIQDLAFHYTRHHRIATRDFGLSNIRPSAAKKKAAKEVRTGYRE